MPAFGRSMVALSLGVMSLVAFLAAHRTTDCNRPSGEAGSPPSRASIALQGGHAERETRGLERVTGRDDGAQYRVRGKVRDGTAKRLPCPASLLSVRRDRVHFAVAPPGSETCLPVAMPKLLRVLEG